MMDLRFGAALLVCVAPAVPAAAGEAVLFGQPPAWVEVRPVATGDDSESTLPARIVSMDQQSRFDDGQQSTYSHVAIQFQTPQALTAAGNVNFAWRPETQEVTVHKVHIRRGDEVIDVLEAGQTFTVLRREQNLEQSVLDGTLTASMFPEGLQVGDVLELASTISTRDPVVAGHAEIAVGPLNFPVDRFSFSLQWPEGRPVTLRKTPELPDWRRSRRGGVETASLTLENVEPIVVPRLAPLRYEMVRFIQASDYKTWADVAAVEIPLYAKAAQIAESGSLRNEVERIRQEFTDPVGRTEAALKLVQGRIRYVLLAMGEGGLVPADAEQTWARRYGDCKAKTVLLLAILGELGIDAEAVTVHTQLGDTLADRLPSMGVFDHILVRARIDGKEYWLDGTRTGDTSLARLQVPDFGWGLPVVEGAELVRIAPLPLEEPASDIVIHMDASGGVNTPVPTRIELTLRGDAAIDTNEAMANFVGEARDRALREYWRRRFNFVEPDKVEIAFDADALEARLLLEGRATMDWKDGWYETDETRLAYRADFSREPGPAQDAPFAVGHPFYTRTSQTIILPEGFAAPSGKDLNVDETVAGVHYRRSTTFADNTLVVEATERSMAREFAAAEAPAFQKRLRELRDNAVYLRMPSRHRAAILLETEPDTANGFFEQGLALMDSGQLEEAVAKFESATALDPGDAWTWANMGVALANMNRLSEAENALDRAHDLDPEVWVIYSGRGRLAERQMDFPAAVAAYTKVIELDPENTGAWGWRAAAYASNNDHSRALADSKRALELAPGDLRMHALRGFILLNSGKRDDARAEIEGMLAAHPRNPQAIAIASEAYRMMGDDQKARSLADAAIEVSPSAITFYQRSTLRENTDTVGKLADLDQALELTPGFFPALAERARLRAESGDVDGALADADEAAASGAAGRDVHVLRANLARDMGRTAEAAASAAAIVQSHNGNTAALADAGRIYASLGMYAEAADAFDKAVAIQPEPFLYIGRSGVRNPLDFDARMADIDEALRRAPTFAGAQLAKASLLAEKGDHAGAVRGYAQALTREPNNVHHLTRRGISLAKLGRTAEAERDFAKARSQTSDAQGLNNICYMKAEQGVALPRALDECEESLKLMPDVAPTLDSRGTVFLQMGRLDEAIADFDRALEKQPGIVHSRYLRAVARYLKGDLSGAEEDAAAARNASPQIVANLERAGFVLSDTPQ